MLIELHKKCVKKVYIIRVVIVIIFKFQIRVTPAIYVRHLGFFSAPLYGISYILKNKKICAYPFFTRST